MDDLLLLAERIKASPELYENEAVRLYNHFKSLVVLLAANPSNIPADFGTCASFLCHVSVRYKTALKTFPDEI